MNKSINKVEHLHILMCDIEDFDDWIDVTTILGLKKETVLWTSAMLIDLDDGRTILKYEAKTLE